MRRGAALLVLLAVLVPAAAAAAPAAERVRAARDAVFARSEFRYGPEEQESLLLRWIGDLQRALTEFQREHPVLYLAGYAAAVLVLLVILAHVVWTVRVAGRRDFEPAAEPREELERALRRGDPGPFRRRAVAAAQQGRLDDAVRDLYTALLLALDRRGSARYAPHKALLDYRLEVPQDSADRAALERFARAYPPGSFGGRPPSAADFEALVATLDALLPGETPAP